MRLAIISAAAILTGTITAYAQSADQKNIVLALHVPVVEQGLGQRMTPIPVHSRWAFVGCEQSHHACVHHAHDHGFRQHTVRHDHNACPSHPHLACYGSN